MRGTTTTTDMADRDPAWEQAMDWVMREHEQGALTASEQAALQHWLIAAPAHRNAYEQARHLWLLTGMLPDNDKDT